VRSLTGKAKLAGVLGWPVGHSLSPRIHGWWLNHHEVDGAYVPMAVEPEFLPPAVEGLRRLGFRGANVTVPHKEAVLALVDEVTPIAQRIGAVNTLIISSEGKIRGENTDWFGFLENLRQKAPSWQPDQPALVLGAGGAARGVVLALLEAGVSNIRLSNRSQERAERLQIDFSKDARAKIEVVSWQEREEACAGVGLVVNTTTQGMIGHPPLEMQLEGLPKTAVVNDIVYVPRETPLLQAARKRGLAVVGGLGMLLHQARPGFAAWFGVMPEVTAELTNFVERVLAE
jgi:shikimate dehydrogenase